MLYDAYEAKMQRIAAVMDKIRRYRVLIITCFALILAAIGAFLFFKGTLVSDAVAPAEPVIYGESIDFRGKALFGKTKSQYRSVDGGEWQDGLPVFPGEYTVRAVSKRSFGITQYGSEQPLTVLKRPLTVALSDTAVYGEYPTHFCEGLASDDTATDISIKYADPYSSVTEATVERLSVLNGAGEDVTACYEITLQGARVTVEKRPITLKTDSAERIYDGTPLLAEGVTVSVGSVAYEDVLSYSSYASLTEVVDGGIPNRPEGLKILNADGADVTHLYAVTEELGRLTVLKRSISALSSSHEKIYDAAPADGTGAALTDGTLVAGHVVQFRFTGGDKTDAGTYENSFEASVTDGSGRDVSGNYEINKNYGVIKIDPRPVTVTGSDRTWIFDGYTHAADTLSPRFTVSKQVADGGLIDGHRLDCVTSATIYRVGETENAVTDARVYDAYGRDVTANYRVTAVSGKLTVLKRAIIVTVKDTEYVFTGEERKYPHESAGQYFSLSLGEQARLPEGMATDTALIEVEAPLGEKTINIGCDYQGSISRVGSVTVTATVVGVYQGTSKITDCYDITVVSGKITVVPRKITIVPEYLSDIYIGRQQGVFEMKVLASLSEPEGQEPMKIPVYPFVWINAKGSDVGTYKSQIVKYVVNNGDGADITDCFEVTKTDGIYEIQKRPIKIIFSSGTWVYDGLPHKLEGDGAYAVVSLVANDVTALCRGHTIRLRTRGEITDVGTEAHGIDGYPTVIDADNNDVSRNYDFSFEEGVLTVTERPITVRTGSAEKTYDGLPLTERSYALVKGSVVDGQVLTVEANGSRTDAGESGNTAYVTVMDGERNVTYNYDITVEKGTLTVTKRPVKYKVYAEGFTYDGRERSEGEICWLNIVEEEGFYPLVAGHEVSDYKILFDGNIVSSVNSLKLAGTYAVSIRSVSLKESGGRDVTANYEFTFVDTEVTVLPRPITVTAASGVFYYDGNTHYANEIEPNYYVTFDGDPSENGIVEGDQVYQAVIEGSITEMGTAPSTVAGITILSDRMEDRSYCYSVTKADGVLTMDKPRIIVISDSAEKVYDGTPLTAHSYTYKGYLYPGDAVSVEYTGSQTEIGFSENLCSYVILNSEGKDVTSSYFALVEYGILNVISEKPPEPPSQGDLGGDVGNDKSDENGEDGKTVFSYVATSDGAIYFRQGHFGKYDPVYGWLDAPVGEDKYSYALLAMEAAKLTSKDTVTVYPASSMLYLSTYYADKSTVGEGRTSTEYSVDYYKYDWLNALSQPEYTGDTKAYEEACRAFAYANYTELPAETRAAMELIIAQAAESAGVDLGAMSKKELVAWVRDYVKGAAVYDLNFPDFPAGVDKAIYFLTTAKRGVCRHFATSAAVMYRALGIPARYTVGYASASVAGQKTEVTGMEAHAWVEVYIDGVGWVAVDPTGGSSGSGGGSSQPQRDVIVLAPYEIRRVYNGSPVICGNGQFWIKSGKDKLPEGYRIEVVIEGSQTRVGKSESVIVKAVIYDADGNDITSQFEVRSEKGVIEVMPIKIVVYTASATKEYDGRRLSAEECSVSMGKLLSGHSIEGVGYGYIVNVGSQPNTVESVRVYDKDGNDVTDCYDIEIKTGTLTVTRG